MEDSNYWLNRPKDDERRDWRNGGRSWVEEYKDSINHPHRNVLIKTLEKIEPFTTVLEIGCNCGVNLSRIRDRFSDLRDYNLYGLDINRDAIDEAKRWLPGINWKVGSVSELPYGDNSFEVVILDAVLMYVGPPEIKKSIEEIVRVCKKSVIIIDWFDESMEGVVKDFHWARNYGEILMKLGYSVTETELTEQAWPSKTWAKNGFVFTAQRA